MLQMKWSNKETEAEKMLWLWDREIGQQHHLFKIGEKTSTIGSQNSLLLIDIPIYNKTFFRGNKKLEIEI